MPPARTGVRYRKGAKTICLPKKGSPVQRALLGTTVVSELAMGITSLFMTYIEAKVCYCGVLPETVHVFMLILGLVLCVLSAMNLGRLILRDMGREETLAYDRLTRWMRIPTILMIPLHIGIMFGLAKISKLYLNPDDHVNWPCIMKLLWFIGLGIPISLGVHVMFFCTEATFREMGDSSRKTAPAPAQAEEGGTD